MTTTTTTYALLLWGDPALCTDLEAAFAAHDRFTQDCAVAGHEIVGGEELTAASTSRLLRVTPTGTEVVDGPYAETTEQLGGFYLIRTADPDALLRLAAPLVMDDGGTLELRPVVAHEGAAEQGAAADVTAGVTA